MQSGVILSPFREEWNGLFREEKERLERALDQNCLAVHHVGSTAVRALLSRDEIDLLAVVEDISLLERHAGVLLSLGYEKAEERIYRKTGYTLYLCERHEKKRIGGFLAIRTYLEDFSESAEEYIKIKNASCRDAAEYQAAKSAFLEKIARDAERYYKRQSRLALTISLCGVLGAFAGLSVGAFLGSAENGAFIGLLIGVALGAFPWLLSRFRRKEK